MGLPIDSDGHLQQIFIKALLLGIVLFIVPSIGVVKMSNNTQKLIKQIAETTGKTSAEIGETLKSIFERFTMVLEIVYHLSKEVGINIFDQNGFRNTDEVMRDFASKWGALSKEKQKEISAKISKHYDLSDFLALINLYKID